MKTPSSSSSCCSPPSHLLLFVFLFFFLSFSHAQQSYISNFQLNCYDTNSSSALGYSCNAPQSSCSSFLIFRAQSPYVSPALISFLLSADVANISRLNSVSDVAPLPAGRLIVIPIPCSCSGKFYQHNASYTLKTLSETYFTVANDTYQGLSTCQTLIHQNPFDSRSLSVSNQLVVPLRCACPTLNQTETGIKYLVSYIIASGDHIRTIAQIFNADYQAVLSANELNEKSTIYPFTTLLIPLSSEPAEISIVPPPSSPPPNVPNPPPPPHSDGGSSNAALIVGVAAGVFLLLLLGMLLYLFFRLKRQRRTRQSLKKESASEIAEYRRPAFKEEKKTLRSPLASTVREMLDWIAVYTFEELLNATGGFDEEHRIQGSVYLGVINGDTPAAIKWVEGDVTREIKILKHISHSNVIKLSGLCLHEANTYLIYEFAEMGSLSDWLQHGDSSSLNWKQRIQIACDVADGLNYLHNYSNPPYIHKNLKSSNVLLGRDFRAKIANLGMARRTEDGREQVTRHVVGTQGYLAPEYLEHGLITPMLDVFAFGVVLLELLSGREAIFVREDEKSREVLLWKAIGGVLLDGEYGKSTAGVRGFVDGCLGDDYPLDLAIAMAELAKRCVSRDAGSRPTMDELLLALSAIHNSTRDWNVEDEAGGSSSGSAIPKR
ncbi:Protein LYK5 [Platanthera guangdongensis]|uniref:Protein LYK5 n=1 Tax=Platanthera guangdongensis TaxID=2320717 RepID=A0ABR2MH35_9ASPA